jgi:hypothetical protein
MRDLQQFERDCQVLKDQIKLYWPPKDSFADKLIEFAPMAYHVYNSLPDLDLKPTVVEAMKLVETPEHACIIGKILADTVHIGKESFMQAMTDALTQLCAGLEKRNKLAVFVLIAGDDCFDKSTFFFLLLAFFLKPELEDLYYGIICINSGKLERLDLWRTKSSGERCSSTRDMCLETHLKVIRSRPFYGCLDEDDIIEDWEFVIIDDGMFSGSQIEHDVVPYLNKHDPKKHVSVCVAYGRTDTIDRILKDHAHLNIYAGIQGPGIDIDAYNVECKSDTIQFLRQIGRIDESNNYKMHHVKTLSPVYFDHKFPDSVSSLPYIYMRLTLDDAVVNTMTLEQLLKGDFEHKPYPLKEDMYKQLLEYVQIREDSIKLSRCGCFHSANQRCRQREQEQQYKEEREERERYKKEREELLEEARKMPRLE